MSTPKGDFASDPRLNAACGGDTAALSALLGECAPQLRAQLSIDRRWQSVLDIDDVLQITYIEAFMRIERFEPSGPNALLSWLRRIAENNLRDAIRGLEAHKRPPTRQAVTGGDASAVALLELLGVTSATPSRAAAANEARAAVESALTQLPEDYARVLRLYDLEGRPIGEVAADLGRTTGAIHMLRARAHDALRDVLGPASDFFSQGA